MWITFVCTKKGDTPDMIIGAFPVLIHMIMAARQEKM